jgi:hypothetical protein
MMDSAPPNPAALTLEAAMITLAAQRGADKSICPSEVARAVGGDHWRTLMPAVRSVAVRLAKDGRVEILRKGKRVDPADFKGVYRVRIVHGKLG